MSDCQEDCAAPPAAMTDQAIPNATPAQPLIQRVLLMLHPVSDPNGNASIMQAHRAAGYCRPVALPMASAAIRARRTVGHARPSFSSSAGGAPSKLASGTLPM